MSLSNKLKRIFDAYATADGRALRKLKAKTRFIAGEVQLTSGKWNYCDGPSFAWQYEEIYNRGIYNFGTEQFKPLIIDCGANIGTSVVRFATLFPNARILAFEPDPKVFSTLEKNVNALCPDANVTLHNKAIYVHNHSIRFEVQGADGGKLGEHGSIEVQCTRLRDLLDQKIDFLKIDIEGAEVEVINDCADLLMNVERLFIEYHAPDADKNQLHTLLNPLGKAGFNYIVETATVHNKRPFIERHSFEGYANLVNIFAFRT